MKSSRRTGLLKGKNICQAKVGSTGKRCRLPCGKHVFCHWHRPREHPLPGEELSGAPFDGNQTPTATRSRQDYHEAASSADGNQTPTPSEEPSPQSPPATSPLTPTPSEAGSQAGTTKRLYSDIDQVQRALQRNIPWCQMSQQDLIQHLLLSKRELVAKENLALAEENQKVEKEKQVTAVKNQRLAEKNQQVAKENQTWEREKQLTEQEKQKTQRDEALKEKEKQKTEREEALKEKEKQKTADKQRLLEQERKAANIQSLLEKDKYLEIAEKSRRPPPAAVRRKPAASSSRSPSASVRRRPAASSSRS